jgi:hypothetical protein
MKCWSYVSGSMLLMVLTLASVCGGQTSQQNDLQAIGVLLSQLSNQSKSPSALLDPTLGHETAAKNLETFQGKYEISVVPASDVKIEGGQTASVSVRVHYRSDQGNSTDINSTANFVNRGGRWYFSDFNFLRWRAFPVIVSLLFGLAGISYMIVVLFMRRKMRASGDKGLVILKSWVPFLWPSILRNRKAK